MRRSASALTVVSILIVLGLFVASWGVSSGAPASRLPSIGTPIPHEEFDGVLVTNLGEVCIPGGTCPDEEPSAGGTPVAGPHATILRLKRVELLPGHERPEQSHNHPGAFTLSVSEGAICYTMLGVEEGEESVATARVAESVTPPTDCPAPDLPCGPNVCAPALRTDCADADGCVLDPGDTVYLPAASTITQTDDALHWYVNVDPNEPAVVYLAEQQDFVSAAPCGGSCH